MTISIRIFFIDEDKRLMNAQKLRLTRIHFAIFLEIIRQKKTDIANQVHKQRYCRRYVLTFFSSIISSSRHDVEESQTDKRNRQETFSSSNSKIVSQFGFTSVHAVQLYIRSHEKIASLFVIRSNFENIMNCNVTRTTFSSQNPMTGIMLSERIKN